MRLWPFVLVVAACGPRSSDRATGTIREDPSGLVATERSSRGGRLVTVREDGARFRELLPLPKSELVVDRNPVFHPSGDWVFFASNRETKSLETSDLWAVPYRGGTPVRLTHGPGSTRDPRVSKDGAWLYFSSDRNGSFDLFRAPLRLEGAGPRLGAAERLTRSEQQELSPSLSPDETALVYMQVDAQGASRIVRLDIESGETRDLSEGPADLTPAWGPTGRIAFSRVAEGRQDHNLYLMSEDGSEPSLVVDAYWADVTGPRWSGDGRYLFAIGVYRSAVQGRPVLGSVVFVDLKETPWTIRALHDQAGPESRIGLALRPGLLNESQLGGAPEYLKSLKRVLRTEIIRRKSENKAPAAQ